MSEIKFDPQTGEPIAQASEPVQPAQQVPAAEQIPQTAPAPAPKKSKTGKIIAGIVAAAVVIGGGAFAVKNLGGNGLGNGTPYEQIKAASEATFVSDELTDQFKAASDIMKDGTYAINATLSASGQNIDLDYNADKGKMSAKIAAAGLEGTLYLDDTKLTLDASSLGIDPLSYDYTSDKTNAADSYIGSMIGSESLGQLDALLKMAYSAANMDKANQEEMEATVDEKFESLEYVEIEKEEIKVGEDTIECAGYSTTVSGEFLADLFDTVTEKSYGKSLTDLVAELNSLGVSTTSEDPLEQIRAMKDIDLKFYINEGKLARVGIKTETEDQSVDAAISFAGKDIPWHETIITNNEDDSSVTLSVKEDGGLTTYEVRDVNDEVQGTLEYHAESGSVTVYSGDETVMTGVIAKGTDGVTFRIGEMSGQTVDVNAKISDDVNVAEAPQGQDILTMSESDFNKIAASLTQVLYGL